jgi:hypothetical protein
MQFPAMPSQRFIKIDQFETWLTIYEPLFANLAPTEVWTRLLNPENYSSADANIEKVARYLTPHVREAKADLYKRLETFLRANFTHVTFYHACRITTPADYERDGVRCADIAEQNRRAEL